MSAVTEAVLKAVDTTLLVIMGDKVNAAKQREIARIVLAVQAGDITVEQGQQQARFEDGDALDIALGKHQEQL